MLVPYTPRPNDWGSWRIRSPYATSTVASPHAVHKQLNKGQKEEELGREEEEEAELVYEPHSPYYSPVHPPEFYDDESTFASCIVNDYIYNYKVCIYEFI